MKVISNVKLLKNGVEINGSRFYEGQLVKIKDLQTGKIVKGTVKFGIYSDGEGYYDYYHLGWRIVYKIKIPPDEYCKKETISWRNRTLIDAFTEGLIIKEV